MKEALNDFFMTMSNNFMQSVIFFGIVTFLSGKFLDVFIIHNIDLKNQYLNDPNRKVFFWVFVLAVFYSVIGLLLNIFFPYPFFWLSSSIVVAFGAGLGLVPFSFIHKKRDKRNDK